MAEHARDIGEKLSLRTADVHTINGGVSIPWLMKAFRLGRATVERKLIGCQPIGQGKHGTPLYDLPDAASYIVTPKQDLSRYLDDLKPEALPEKLREPYWNAKLKQQRFEEKAGHLWRTEKVLDVFSEVLQRLRTRLQLVPNDVERETALTPEQHTIITRIVDDVQDDIYQELVALAKVGKTPNQLGEERKSDRVHDDLI